MEKDKERLQVIGTIRKAIDNQDFNSKVELNDHLVTEEEREKYFEMRIPANMYIWATMNIKVVLIPLTNFIIRAEFVPTGNALLS